MGKYVNVRIERTIKSALDIYIALQGARTGRRPTLSQAIEQLLIKAAPDALEQAVDAVPKEASTNDDA